MFRQKFVTTVLGRKAWLNPYSDQCPRNARNSPIQGCLPKDTNILTDVGWKPIGEFTFGQVWTGKNWALAEKIYMGESRRVRLHLSDGRTFDCDDRHYLLTQDRVWPDWTHIDNIIGKSLVRDINEGWGMKVKKVEIKKIKLELEFDQEEFKQFAEMVHTVPDHEAYSDVADSIWKEIKHLN